MSLRTQCKGVAEEGSGRINVFKIISIIAFKAGPRKVGESCCAVWMADRTLIQNRLKTPHSIIQMRDCLVRHVFGDVCMAGICVSSNIAFYEVL
jgi:hypothetical protein